ncbi:MAG: class I SAM-dependent methyltransferase [Actinomycetota bacterium]|nr:class I SAM-dependent methyltransferase [Actinomycetota bacterium]
MELVEGAMSSFAREKLGQHTAYTVDGPGLGPVNRATLMRDPRHLGFTLARYKFVSKMLQGMSNVCEIGCHEATGSLVVASEVQHLTALDVMQDVIDFCHDEYDKFGLNITFAACDVLEGLPASLDPSGKYEAVYCLDVLEHVDPAQEHSFLSRIVEGLSSDGVAIVGIPSLQSQAYASPVSAVQHINCKTSEELKQFMEGYFSNVFMFGMNDEVLHTGFSSMCHYIFALAVGPK